MNNPVTLDLVTPEAKIPAPDNLLVGPRGAVYTDIVKVRVADDGTLTRGTLLMSDVIEDEKVFVACTVAGLTPQASSVPVTVTGNSETVDVNVPIPDGRTFGILADTVTIPADEHAETAVYFEGDFNANAIILPWEAEEDDHGEQIEIVREPLRRQKIFLRNVHK
ncbi:MAG: hypothetical protein LBS53_06265 [Synergistaceae bacterium]|jgi:hypothetical protein|nr:hypothetical protein [Synergistaceae bacterium]